MKTIEEKIIKMLSGSPGNITDIYYAVYEEFFKKKGFSWQELRTVIEYCGIVGSDDKNPARISVEQRQKIINIYGNALQEIVHVLVNENLETDNFYKKLYTVVFKSDIFPQDEIVHTVLLELMARSLRDLPYYPLRQPLVMSEEEFRKAFNEMLPQIRKGISIVNRGLNSNTEIISQLWNIANELDTDKKKIIFFSAMVGLAGDKDKPGRRRDA